MWLPAVDAPHFADETWLTDWSNQLESELRRHNGAGPRYQVSLVTEEGEPSIRVRREHHGVTTEKIIHAGFFRSPEYRRIADLGAELQGLLDEGAYVVRGKEQRDVVSFPEAIDWLMDQAKRGQNIQRYKGLGEMNPDQLWETTVNPETRRLMQVRIEDAVAADEIFTTLMGDQVEPRRDFIERNALAVANLDI